jgi:hypothetical protein
VKIGQKMILTRDEEVLGGDEIISIKNCLAFPESIKQKGSEIYFDSGHVIATV